MNFDAISKNVKFLKIDPVEPKLWKNHQILEAVTYMLNYKLFSRWTRILMRRPTYNFYRVNNLELTEINIRTLLFVAMQARRKFAAVITKPFPRIIS